MAAIQLENYAEKNASGNIMPDVDIESAIRDGDIKKVENWLTLRKYYICEPVCKRTQRTALHLAASCGNVEITKLLLETAIDSDATIELLLKAVDDSGLTPVDIAINEKHTNVIESILSYKKCVRPCVLPVDMKFGIPLHRACRLGYNECVKILLKHNNISEGVQKQQLRATTLESKYTPLHQAALKGQTDTIKLLNELCSSPDVAGKLQFEELLLQLRNKSDNAAIHVAIIGGNLQTVKTILEISPTCISLESETLGTPFYTACHYGRVDIVKYLAESGASIHKSHSVSNSKDHIDSGSGSNNSQNNCQRYRCNDVEDPANPKEMTPLMIACLNGHKQVVQFLLDLVEIKPRDLIQAIKGGSEETAAALIMHHGERWKSLLRYSYNGTTPFQQLIEHMPNVAKLVLEKSIKIENEIPSFDYEFVDGYKSDREGGDTIDNTWPAEPSSHKNSLPLSTMIKFKRVDLLTHPVVTSRIHTKLRRFGYLSLLHWALYLLHLVFITLLFLMLSHCQLLCQCNKLNCTQTKNFSSNVNTSVDDNNKLGAVHTFFSVWASVYIIIRVLLKIIRVVFTVFNTYRQLKKENEFNRIKTCFNFIKNVVEFEDILEVLLFILTLIYSIKLASVNQCPSCWISQLGSAVIFFSWLEFIILSTQFKLVGVYVLMLVKVLKSFLKAFILLGLMVSTFALALYIPVSGMVKETINNDSEGVGYNVLNVISMITGQNFEQFINDPIVFVLFLIFIVVMVVLFTNLLIGLAVGDIQNIYDSAKFQEIALRVNFILDVECSIQPFLKCVKKQQICKKTDDEEGKEPAENTVKRPSLCDMIYSSFIVLLWGGESFDSKESYEKVAENYRTFLNSTKNINAKKAKRATYEDVTDVREDMKSVLLAIQEFSKHKCKESHKGATPEDVTDVREDI